MERKKILSVISSFSHCDFLRVKFFLELTYSDTIEKKHLMYIERVISNFLWNNDTGTETFSSLRLLASDIKQELINNHTMTK